MIRHYAKVVVCGAGTMGHSLALLHARKAEVWLTDLSEQTLTRAMRLIGSALDTLERAKALDESPDSIMARIHCTQHLAPCLPGADLIVEAIYEDAGLKQSFFNSLTEGACEKALEAHTLIASNTSSLDIFALAPASLQHRLYAAHHFVPPHIIPLAEIVSPKSPLPGSTENLLSHYKACGAIPVLLERFCHGFVVNRIQTAIHREMFKLLEEGVISPTDLDLAVKASLGVRIPVLGILKRLDFAGLDLVEGNMSRLGLTPPKVLHELTRRGDCGVKSGKGFYDYSDRTPEAVFEERDMAMLSIRNSMEAADLLSGEISKECRQ